MSMLDMFTSDRVSFLLLSIPCARSLSLFFQLSSVYFSFLQFLSFFPFAKNFQCNFFPSQSILNVKKSNFFCLQFNCIHLSSAKCCFVLLQWIYFTFHGTSFFTCAFRTFFRAHHLQSNKFEFSLCFFSFCFALVSQFQLDETMDTVRPYLSSS